MGFLNFCKKKQQNKMLGILMASIACILCVLFINTSSAYAAYTTETGIFTDSNDVRWEYNRAVDLETSKEAVTIKYFDRPSNATEIVVPSLSEVLANVPNASQDLDTYFLDNANDFYQSNHYSETKRESTASVTKLDMSNTSKIQILGIRPMLDPNVETELVFGENMVIGDAWHWLTKLTLCTGFEDWDDFGSYWACSQYEEIETNLDEFLPYWNLVSEEQKKNYRPTLEELNGHLGYNLVALSRISWRYPIRDAMPIVAGDPLPWEDGNTYYTSFWSGSSEVHDGLVYGPGDGVFSGYKLKLTNFGSFNYVGWYAFANSVLNEANTDITIVGEGFTGGDIFKDTNVRKVTIKTSNTGHGLFKNCNNLTEVVFDDNVDTIGAANFMGTNLGTIDLSNTNIKTIKENAFESANITSVDFGDVETILWHAFRYNDIKELYMPKSINWLGVQIFSNNPNLKKVTIAYDTMTSGTTYPFFVSYLDDASFENHLIEEIELIAPYAADEPVKPTHVSYDEYRWGFNSSQERVEERYDRSYGNWGSESIGVAGTGYGRSWGNQLGMVYESEDHFANVERFKNVVAPNYFRGMESIKKITIGEGYEYIGSIAFYTLNTGGYELWGVGETGVDLYLPSTLKGIGTLALDNLHVSELNLPESLEFIGIGAFRGMQCAGGFDVDLPNLVFLGDHSFKATNVRNVTLHDKMRYLGHEAFGNALYINNITIDFDIFNPEVNAYYTRQPQTSGGVWDYNTYGYNTFRTMFGISYDGFGYLSSEELDSLGYRTGIRRQSDNENERKGLKYGTITFTEKAVTDYPEFLYVHRSSLSSPSGSAGGRGDYFAWMLADKIDLSKTGWKKIPPYFFVGGTYGEVLLPENLESIKEHAFDNAIIESEFTLPDSIKEIGESAFNTWALGNNGLGDYGITITKLPESLLTVHNYAFEMDKNLTADLNSPNLIVVANSAFSKTGIKNITLPNSLSYIGNGAFFLSEDIENIVIDCDFYRISSSRGFHGTFGKGYSQYSGQGYYYNSVTFTENAVTEPVNMGAIFHGYDFGTFDMSQTGWKNIPSSYAFGESKINKMLLPTSLEEIPVNAFDHAEITEPLTIPETVKTIGYHAFDQAKLSLANDLPEGLETIGESAFYGADIHGDMTIPSTVTSIGWSAFNAGDTDVHYGTVTIKPSLDYDKTNSQAVFQMFWNASMDKLVIESPSLPVLATTGENPVLPHEVQYQALDDGRWETVTINPTLRDDGEPEFHSMNMKEVVIKNLPEITANAFEECANLEKVTFSSDAALGRIGKYSFNNATKLKQVIFGEANNNHDISIEEYAFNNTAIESLGTTNDSDFNLAAANFNTVQEHVFSNMPKLKTVDIPNNFNIDESMANAEKNVNGSHIASFTFSDDPELEQVTIGYQVSEIRDGAFLNDEKLTKLFVWGNTEIQESDQLIQDFNNTTIPKGTTIFAYSDAPAEAYANDESRDEYTGEFYALDEVLAITSNRNVVILNEDKTDFDKTGLKLYAQRRDGVILESDWKDYNTAFKRTETPEGTNISFEEGRGRVGSDEADIASEIFDAPKPFDIISLANRNFENVDFELLPMPSSDDPLVVVHYPDGYTGNIRNTTILAKTATEIIEENIPDPEPEPEKEPEEELSVPDTGAYGALIGATTSSLSIATIVVLGCIFIVKKRRN